MLLGTLAHAEPVPELPPIEMTRWSERYSAVTSRDLRGLDRLKRIPLGDTDKRFLSLGGSIREQLEGYRNRDFGFSDANDDVYLLHRLLLHADLHASESVRMFAEVGNTLIEGRQGEPSPVDENQLFVNQAFIDARWEFSEANAVRTRLGRQELPFGSGRLLSLRDGPNNRLSFDAARVTVDSVSWTVDAILAAPVDIRRGMLDDRFNDDALLWGIYSTHEVEPGEMSINLYYLGIARTHRRFGSAEGDETRHSIGTRVFGAISGVDYNLEAVGQFGSLGDADIRAWTIASDIGYTWKNHSWKPRIGLRANIQSGARGGREITETFDPLFPSNSYFSEAAALSPSNLMDINPSVRLHPSPGLQIDGSWDFVWRTSEQDSVYAPPGVPLFEPEGSAGRFVGHSVSVRATQKLGRGATVNSAYTHFFVGDAMRTAGGEGIDYFALWMDWKF